MSTLEHFADSELALDALDDVAGGRGHCNPCPPSRCHTRPDCYDPCKDPCKRYDDDCQRRSRRC